MAARSALTRPGVLASRRVGVELPQRRARLPPEQQRARPHDATAALTLATPPEAAPTRPQAIWLKSQRHEG